ncbi:aminoacyl-tRNA hydrolase [Myotisia sp. PD_48]|nr:aminoacyl-tRNA hydrolase [Myotisia sp. PD_48]
MAPASFFVASIGNPGQAYYNTLHSAGHILLRTFAELMNAAEFTANPQLAHGLTTETYLPRSQSRLTLWQSPSYMNTSGVSLAKAYKNWLQQENMLLPSLPIHTTGKPKNKKQQPPQSKSKRTMNLIILHDELEKPYGNLLVRYGGADTSSRGHRGLQSVVKCFVDKNLLPTGDKSKSLSTSSLPSADAFMRLSIGVGRPVSRDSASVADYLISQISKAQHDRLAARAINLRELLEIEISRINQARELEEEELAQRNQSLTETGGVV